MTDWRDETLRCKRCGIEVRRKRRSQKFCGEQCRAAHEQQMRRKRNRPHSHENPLRNGGGYPPTGNPLRVSLQGIDNKGDLGADFEGYGSDKPTMIWPEKHDHHGPTPGALQGDDYPLEYYEDGFPKLPACLDRRPKPALARVA